MKNLLHDFLETHHYEGEFTKHPAQNPSRIRRADRNFLQRVITLYKIPNVKIEWSESKKVHPDIWCYPNERPPRIVVTQEWARQGVDERRKRLVHEVVGHMVYKWPHTPYMERLGFSTYPRKDRISRWIYQDTKRGIAKPGRYYLDRAAR